MFPSCEATEMRHTLKQPIRAEPPLWNSQSEQSHTVKTANQNRATMWNSQSEQSHTVKQPIRAALWNSQSEHSCTVKQPIRTEPHCETANQSRAQHWAVLWNSQSEQSSTLAVLWNSQSEQSSEFNSGEKSKGCNAHVKLFLEICSPYLRLLCKYQRTI